jgi:Phage integrase family
MILSSPTQSNIEEWLNQEMTAKGGGTFRPADDLWRPDQTAQSINAGSAKQSVPEKAQPWLVTALAYYTKEYSVRTVVNLAGTLSLCARLKMDVIDENFSLTMRDRLSRSAFSALRKFLKYWFDLDKLTIRPSQKVISSLFDLRLKSTNVCPVESMDPVKGPFTELEEQALFDWSNDAYTDGRLSIERFVYIRLLIATGARSRQIQQLVFGDISNSAQPPTIQMPNAKDNSFEYRSSFRAFKLAPDLYSILACYKRLLLQKLKSDQPGVDWEKAILNVPLFCAKGNSAKDRVIAEDPELIKLEIHPQEKFHKPSGSLSALLMGLEEIQGFPISERTGKPLHLGSHRFRHTLGTDMSRMGYGPHAIADALNHKGIHTVGRYIKTSPEMGKRIDDKMKLELALVVNAFQGRIVFNETEAVNGSDPTKRIRSESGDIASCGASGGCHLDAPVACYLCSKFQPFVEGPHEEVLERLLLRQKRAITADGEGSSRAISFDRPILAVMQVIDEIRSLDTEKQAS